MMVTALLVDMEKADMGWQQASLPSHNPITRWIFSYQLLRNYGNSWCRALIAGWFLGVRGCKTLVDPRQRWKFRPNGR
jgi:hypothetical protein